MNPGLESFLSDVVNHVAPAKGLTIFSVGGRGYYENPAPLLVLARFGHQILTI